MIMGIRELGIGQLVAGWVDTVGSWDDETLHSLRGTLQYNDGIICQVQHYICISVRENSYFRTKAFTK